MKETHTIRFQSNLHLVIWNRIIVPEITDGRWSKSPMHNQSRWSRANTEVANDVRDLVGTTIPAFEPRFDLIKDEFMFDKGWKIIALMRLTIIYGSKGVRIIPKSVEALIDHIIAIDFADTNNKDYRRSQVRSAVDVYSRATRYTEHGQDNFNHLKLMAEKNGFAFEGIVEALKIDVYGKTDLNRDIKEIMTNLKIQVLA